jgi:hypothetical protein
MCELKSRTSWRFVPEFILNVSYAVAADSLL